MKIGYARVSTTREMTQKLDLQMDALIEAGIDPQNIYTDRISGAKAERPGLAACLKALRPGDTLIVWALDRLGRNLRHLINIIQEMEEKQISFKCLTGQGANIDTTTAQGKMIFSIFAALAEYERELIRERTRAGIAAARARGKNGGRKHKLSKNQIRYIEKVMRDPDTVVADLCRELEITRATLYRYVDPRGQLRPSGEKVLGR